MLTDDERREMEQEMDEQIAASREHRKPQEEIERIMMEDVAKRWAERQSKASGKPPKPETQA